MYFMLYINILLLVNMKTFYMHHYLCIVQCVDEKKKIRCTLLNINAKQRNAKIKKNTNNSLLWWFHSVLSFGKIQITLFLWLPTAWRDISIL